LLGKKGYVVVVFVKLQTLISLPFLNYCRNQNIKIAE